MKRTLIIAAFCIAAGSALAQNGVWGPMGVYGPQYNPATLIGNGGNILVGENGNWYFDGNIVSADKGNGNAPNDIGRSEKIIFSGTGTFENSAIAPAAVANPSNGYIINGYAAVADRAAPFVLPIGNETAAFAVTVPGSVTVSAAYFDGAGTTQNKQVEGTVSNNTVQYSPYIDMPDGIAAGTYSFSYPAGFGTSNNALLSSGNTSASGTSAHTTYNLLANVSDFSATAHTTTAMLPDRTKTQLYFSSSTEPLPLRLISFEASVSGCNIAFSWKTASDNEALYYALEKSTDGTSFSTIVKVISKGSTTTAMYNYRYRNTGADSKGLYRLVIVTEDNKRIYSNVLPLTLTGICKEARVLISPNPADRHITMSGLEKGSNIRISDLSGRKVAGYRSVEEVPLTIDVSSYAQGIYIIETEGAPGKVAQFKLMKQ